MPVRKPTFPRSRPSRRSSPRLAAVSAFPNLQHRPTAPPRAPLRSRDRTPPGVRAHRPRTAPEPRVRDDPCSGGLARRSATRGAANPAPTVRARIGPRSPPNRQGRFEVPEGAARYARSDGRWWHRPVAIGAVRGWIRSPAQIPSETRSEHESGTEPGSAGRPGPDSRSVDRRSSGFLARFRYHSGSTAGSTGRTPPDSGDGRGPQPQERARVKARDPPILDRPGGASADQVCHACIEM